MCDITKPHARCRCARHRAARARLWNLRKMGRPEARVLTSARGTTRRLRALAVMGHSTPAVSQLSGVPVSTLQNLRGGRNEHVTPGIARAVERAARILFAHPPRMSQIASRTRNQALARGWRSVMEWNDIDNDPEPCKPGMSRSTQYRRRKVA